MGEMVGRKQAAGDTKPQESPLVPNKTMQRMYEGIVESRMLEEFLHKRDKKAKLVSTRGQEACRIAALVDVDADDLVSDLPSNLTTSLLLGAELSTIVEHADARAAGKKKAAGAVPELMNLLPEVKDSADRLHMSLGAALALKRLKPSKVVIVFTEIEEIKTAAWKKILHFAAREELPMLFVVLPSATGKVSGKAGKKIASFDLSTRATATGVPGIPVDASDAVALYRVVQESVGRARAGGGPALMECTHFFLEGEKKVSIPDPAVAMGKTLLSRRVCDGEWLTGVISQFQARLNIL